MNDDWRLRVDVREDGGAHELTDRLEASDLTHDLSTEFHDRVIVSRDGPMVFCYAATRQQAEAAENVIRGLAEEHGWHVTFGLEHWHPVAEAWESPDLPLPGADAELAAERRELMERERLESTSLGHPEWEVRVRCRSHRDAQRLADDLRQEGVPSVHRWEFVVLGAPDEDTARALAARIQGEVPEGSAVSVEASIPEVVSEAPHATPFQQTPFAIFGGLAG
jgi:hypothetical protein